MQCGSKNGLWSAVLVATVACGCSESGGVPVASKGSDPANLVATPLGGGVHLTWTDNSDDEELFEIERKAGLNAFQTISTVPFNAALYHDSDVSLGAAYTYRVRAKHPTSFSAYTNEATVNLANGAGGQTGASGAGGINGSAGNGSGTGGNGVSGNGTSVSGAGGTGTVGSGGTGGPAPDVSFKTDVKPSLVKTCGSTTTGCHSRDQAVGRIMPQFGPCKVIWFSSVDESVGATFTSGPNQGQPTGCTDLDLYQRLMELHSMLCDAPSWEQRARYVVPGNLDQSLLYQVVAGDSTMGGACTLMAAPVRRMPLIDKKILPEPVLLGADEVAKIRDWILQGAKNN